MTDLNIKAIFEDIPPMATNRLYLRKISVNDAEDMYEYASDRDTTEYLTWEPHGALKFTKNYLRFLQKQYKCGQYLDWAIVYRENGKMIGTCGFSAIYPEHGKAEIGYVLNRAYRNKGIATEACGLVISYAFEQLDIHRIEAKCIVGNDASERVMKKLGMKYEGTYRESMYVKGEYRDIKMYSILSDEYFKRKYNIE